MIVIDLFGDEDIIITISPEDDPKEVARKEEVRQRALEEIFRRTPQPTLQIVPIEK